MFKIASANIYDKQHRLEESHSHFRNLIMNLR